MADTTTTDGALRDIGGVANVYIATVAAVLAFII